MQQVIDNSDNAVLLLSCGLPGAGKTTLARQLTAHAAPLATDNATPSAWCVELLSFDDLFRASTFDSVDAFDPAEWKRCQRAMAERVRAWRQDAQRHPDNSSSRRQLVLLVDDNFQLRSLRKRFAHLADEVDCGFGILYIDTPLALCQARNAARTGADRVPDPVIERMAQTFEAPGSAPFERNTCALQLQSLDAHAVRTASESIVALVRSAIAYRDASRQRAARITLEMQQRARDVAQTQRAVVHRVDLALRKWISSTLATGGRSCSSSSRNAKAERARRLNAQRKTFLEQLRSRCSVESIASDGENDVAAAVVSEVERFCCDELTATHSIAMMHDDVIHAVDISHAASDDGADLELEVPNDAAAAAAVASDATASNSSATTSRTLRTSMRLKVASVVLAVVGAVAVGLAVASHSFSSSSTSSATSVVGDSDSVSAPAQIAASPMDVTSSALLPSEPPVFLRLVAATDSSAAQFVLAKAHWNRSFLVYPMVEKHSGPPRAGLERGAMLLDTTDYVFHFDRSLNNASLRLVPENHRARLAAGHDDLAAVYDASHWTGYALEVPIAIETDDTFVIDADWFFASGFFVATALATSLYELDVAGSAFYPRNAVVRAEYLLESGVAVVVFAIGLLPETPMPQRVADDRVGYFSSRYTLYGGDGDGDGGPAANVSRPSDDGFHFMDPAVTVVNRRRLERDPTTNATTSPIVYYIDPSVPARWRNAFAAGVNAWQPAFDAIGFHDAVRAVVPGDADWPTDFRLGDVRYNSISVMISDQTYALGPSVIDPRSGEILQSAIIFELGFFNDVVADFDRDAPVDPPVARSASRDTQTTRRLRQCGFAQREHHRTDRMLLSLVAGADDGDAHAFVSDELVSQHFTDIVMHEVGHTLGLRHNFAGSSLVTRAQLRDAAFVRKHGLSTSIMDYVPVNIFSDLTSAEAATHRFYMTTIGSYDMAAIAYGYAVVPDEQPGQKSSGLTALARAAPFFLTDEDIDATSSPYGQRFDLSDDPVAYAADRLALAKRLRGSNALLYKVPDDASWTVLWRREAALLRMINNSVDVLAPMLGGVNVSHAHRSGDEQTYAPTPVPRKQQLQALDVLKRVVASDHGLFPAPAEYATYIQVRGLDGEDCSLPSLEYYCLARGLVDVDSVILDIQRSAITRALFPVMARIVSQDTNAPVKLPELLAALRNATSYTTSKATKAESGSRVKVLRAYLEDALQEVVDDATADVRVTDAILSVFPNVVPSRDGSESRA